MSRIQILRQVYAERERQVALWGDQHHSPARWLAILAEEFGEVAGDATKLEFGQGDELPADREALLMAELVQVAAVAVAWLEDIHTAVPGASSAPADDVPPSSAPSSGSRV